MQDSTIRLEQLWIPEAAAIIATVPEMQLLPLRELEAPGGAGMCCATATQYGWAMSRQ